MSPCIETTAKCTCIGLPLYCQQKAPLIALFLWKSVKVKKMYIYETTFGSYCLVVCSRGVLSFPWCWSSGTLLWGEDLVIWLLHEVVSQLCVLLHLWISLSEIPHVPSRASVSSTWFILQLSKISKHIRRSARDRGSLSVKRYYEKHFALSPWI